MENKRFKGLCDAAVFKLMLGSGFGTPGDLCSWRSILFGPAYSSDEAGDGPSTDVTMASLGVDEEVLIPSSIPYVINSAGYSVPAVGSSAR